MKLIPGYYHRLRRGKRTRTVVENIYGNWRGYEGSTFVKEFANSSEQTAEQAAIEWMEACPDDVGQALDKSAGSCENGPMKKDIERLATAVADALFQQPAEELQRKLQSPDYVAGLLAGFALRVLSEVK